MAKVELRVPSGCQLRDWLVIRCSRVASVLANQAAPLDLGKLVSRKACKVAPARTWPPLVAGLGVGGRVSARARAPLLHRRGRRTYPRRLGEVLRHAHAEQRLVGPVAAGGAVDLRR